MAVMTELWDERTLEDRCARFRRAKLALDRGASDEELQALMSESEPGPD